MSEGECAAASERGLGLGRNLGTGGKIGLAGLRCFSAETAGEGRRFADTDLFAHACDQGVGRDKEVARYLLDRLWMSSSSCTSVQSLQELLLSFTRKLPKPLIPRGTALVNSIGEAAEV